MMEGIILRKLIILMMLYASLHSQDEYQLGDGAQVGSLPLYIGGYFSIDYKSTEDSKQYRIDDIAFLAYGSSNKFSYIAELEFKEFYVKTDTNDTITTQKDQTLYTERVYIDYNLDGNYLLRAGKYNSPIGFWNLLPINVLRETTSSPKSSYILFPKFTTGLYSSYTTFEDAEFKLDIMLQNNKGIYDSYNNYHVNTHYGLGLSYEMDELTIKLNGGYFKDTDLNIPLYYALLSMKYENDDFQILSEIGSQNINEESSTNYAAYLQGVYRFTPRHLGIIRLESYDSKNTNQQDDFVVFGYTYRPLYPIALKAEYQSHSIESENQFLFSFSVLF